MKYFAALFCLLMTSLFPGEKRVFVTGGAGFIGSNFLEYMFGKYPDYHFVALDALTYAGSMGNIPHWIRDSERFEFVYGNVTDSDLVERLMKESDFVVHFAAETHVTRSIDDDEVFFETDVMGTRSMMSALLKNNRTVERFIHVSTSEVYGTAEEGLPMDESHPLNPRSPYAAAKAGADRLVYAYGCTFDVPVVTVRPFNNYGPRQHPEKMIPRFITAALQGKKLQIHGTGDQCRDWVHTADICRGLDEILHCPDFLKLKNQTVNLGSGKAVSVLEIALRVLRVFDLPSSSLEFVQQRPGQVACHLADSKLAKDLLGWKPEIDLSEGLERTIEWYRKHPENWREKCLD